MNCPHCQEELPADYPAGWCPFCGKDLFVAGTDLPAFESRWVSWPKFFIILFAPAIGCFLALTIDIGGLAVLLGLFGSLVSGLICARMIMENVNLMGFKRGLAHFGLAMLLCATAWFLCFLGCTSGAAISNHGI
jgi:hypothetical protein